MSDNKQHGVGYTVSLCGVMSALALALMFMMGMVPSFEYISPAIGGILIWVVRKNLSIIRACKLYRRKRSGAVCSAEL